MELSLQDIVTVSPVILNKIVPIMYMEFLLCWCFEYTYPIIFSFMNEYFLLGVICENRKPDLETALIPFVR
jgi:hypothetical protein